MTKDLADLFPAGLSWPIRRALQFPVLKTGHLFFLFLLLSSFVLHARDYSFYYRQTALAEENLRNGRLTDALKHYDSAFARYDFKYAKDCYIAAQIAAYEENNEKTFWYVTYAIRAGVKYQCLQNNRLFKKFWESEYAGTVQREKDSNRSVYLKRIDLEKCKEWSKRFEEEQAVKGKGEVYYQKVADNVAAIEKLLRRGIFPGERLIGVDNSIAAAKIHVFRPEDTCDYATSRATPTLKHYKYSYEVFRSQLIEAMLGGYLHPYELLDIFIFNKNKVSRVELPKEYKKELSLDTSKENGLYFQRAFERGHSDSLTVLKNRFDWYIPRPGKYEAEDLRQRYGIDIEIGSWIDWWKSRQ